MENSELSQQEINEITVNIPLEFNIKDRTVKIRSRTIYDMVNVDRKIEAFENAIANKVDYDENGTEKPMEYVTRIHQQQRIVYSEMAKVIHAMINDADSEEFTLEWIESNIDMTDGGLGEQIVDAYNEKCMPKNLVKKILLSKKFS